MTKKQVKFTSASLIIVAAVFYLIYTGINQTSVYFFTVSELINKKGTIAEEGVRVNGTVVPGSIDQDKSNLKVNFKITDSKKNLLVYYEGIIPDMFKENIDVVVEGTVDQKGNLNANTLLTACPSKYEEEKKELTNKI
ncbi:MAG TPA: cytochrome c maturation protein CcmE [Nitrospinota bacterium]|jgi:cytochrome c-type biogenesis protein CcmE|nr:cytochrome c maturation protein CcmE [Nitrospinota bacterium]